VGPEAIPPVQPQVIPPVEPVPQSSVSIVETVQPISTPAEPQWTILLRPPSRIARKELRRIQDQRSVFHTEAGEESPPEPLAIDTPKMGLFLLQTEHVQESPQASLPTSAHKDISVLESSEGSRMEPIPEKKESKPVAVLQPVPMRHGAASIQPAAQTASQAPQRVVEIHIGRIEVRATPPSTPVKRGSQKATTMSLEEYLRSRPGEK
jgi:hypothetical protein